MKDLAWWAVFVLAMVSIEFVEDYRQDRCVDRGGAWVKAPGCESDYCNRTAGAHK